MITLDLVLPDTQYPIHIGTDLFARADLILPHLAQKKVAIVTNDVVAPLYLARLQSSLEHAGVQVLTVVLPDGEANKTWHSLNLIFDTLLEHGAERKTTLIALGGGVVGDMTGFAAACWQRGAPFIQIPTTVLAQVDSSVGGKTAINHPKGKNMIGAFHQPRLVLADMALLDTLPQREVAAGIAEIIKYGLLGDAAFFSWLETNMPALLRRDRDALAYAVKRSCEMKAEIVAADEKELGVRALLNLGHTFGHAIETGVGYGSWLHGEAVAVGMLLAAETSYLLGELPAEAVTRIAALLEAAQLPTYAPDLGFAQWMTLMSHDKKVENGVPRFVLLPKLGQAEIRSNVPVAVLQQVLSGRWILATKDAN